MSGFSVYLCHSTVLNDRNQEITAPRLEAGKTNTHQETFEFWLLAIGATNAVDVFVFSIVVGLKLISLLSFPHSLANIKIQRRTNRYFIASSSFFQILSLSRRVHSVRLLSHARFPILPVYLSLSVYHSNFAIGKLGSANLFFPSYVDFVSTFYDIHFSFKCVFSRMLQKAEETLHHSK